MQKELHFQVWVIVVQAGFGPCFGGGRTGSSLLVVSVKGRFRFMSIFFFKKIRFYWDRTETDSFDLGEGKQGLKSFEGGLGSGFEPRLDEMVKVRA